jgi:hypothetical protein
VTNTDVRGFQGLPSDLASALAALQAERECIHGSWRVRTATERSEDLILIAPKANDDASGVDLTFATHLAANSQGECQIPNSTRNIYLLVVL